MCGRSESSLGSPSSTRIDFDRMRWALFARTVLKALFILYCIEVGVLLVLSPWRDLWPRLISEIPWHGLRSVLNLPAGRGVVTGFGLVHLVWGFHDLNQVLGQLGRGRRQGLDQVRDSQNVRS